MRICHILFHATLLTGWFYSGVAIAQIPDPSQFSRPSVIFDITGKGSGDLQSRKPINFAHFDNSIALNDTHFNVNHVEGDQIADNLFGYRQVNHDKDALIGMIVGVPVPNPKPAIYMLLGTCLAFVAFYKYGARKALS